MACHAEPKKDGANRAMTDFLVELVATTCAPFTPSCQQGTALPQSKVSFHRLHRGEDFGGFGRLGLTISVPHIESCQFVNERQPIKFAEGIFCVFVLSSCVAPPFPIPNASRAPTISPTNKSIQAGRVCSSFAG